MASNLTQLIVKSQEPFPGWVDTVSAAGALYLLGGIGLIKVCKGDPTVIGDQIPVDICSDTIIVATALYANQKDITVFFNKGYNISR